MKGTDLVKSLLERSEQNRDKNRRELQDKYCFRYKVTLMFAGKWLFPPRQCFLHYCIAYCSVQKHLLTHVAWCL